MILCCGLDGGVFLKSSFLAKLPEWPFFTPVNFTFIRAGNTGTDRERREALDNVRRRGAVGVSNADMSELIGLLMGTLRTTEEGDRGLYSSALTAVCADPNDEGPATDGHWTLLSENSLSRKESGGSVGASSRDLPLLAGGSLCSSSGGVSLTTLGSR